LRLSRAFTLRDLAALLCLAALALPVLAGALGGAKDLSIAERCRVTLAALTRAVLVYTAQNRGYMPVYQHDFYDTGNRYVRAPDFTYKSAVAFSGSYGFNPVTGFLADVRGFGLVYVRGFIRPPELFYCPGPMSDVRHTYANYPKPWGRYLGPGSNFVRLGYMWNPWIKHVPGTSSNYWTYEDGLVLTRHPKERFLICDLLLSVQTISHPLGRSDEWYLGYPDGSVGRFEDDQLRGILAGPGLDSMSDWLIWNQYVRPRLPGANP
jgi:hypothetical protein